MYLVASALVAFGCGGGDIGDGGAGGDDGGGDDGGGRDTGGGRDDGAGGDTGGGRDTGGGDDVAAGGYCDSVASWAPAQSAAEEEVLKLVNQHRSRGADCGSEGSFEATGPLAMHPALRCAARVHTADMADNDFFDHTNPDGETPWDRMERAGYTWSTAGENIAGGSTTAEDAVAQWMGSDGHCANIMGPGFEHIGIGYVAEARLWTQVFGASR